MHGVTGMSDTCVFCEIAARRCEASIVVDDALTVTFVDLRQFHSGHVLVIPRRHFNDIRDMDETSLQAVMSAVARAARAVDRAFPGDGLSIWHSAGEGANQEVPHAHFHVHPRRLGDQFFDVYPRAPETPARASLDAIAGRLRASMAE
jgi:histidine triad (HIT) family protein